MNRADSMVVISYSRKSIESARRIQETLEGLGFDCWRDDADILAGDDWARSISEAVRTSDAVVVLLDEHSVRSDHVANEIAIAAGQNKAIIPVAYGQIDDLGTLDYHLSRPQRIDLTEADGSGEQRLIDALDRKLDEAQRARRNEVSTADIESPAADADATVDTATTPPGREVASYRLRLVTVSVGDDVDGYAVSSNAVAGVDRMQPDLDTIAERLWTSARPAPGPVRRASPKITEQEATPVVPSADDVEEVGRLLRRSFVSERLASSVRDELGSAEPTRGEAVRVIVDTTEAPDLARLPWEFLAGEEDGPPLSRNGQVSVVRLLTGWPSTPLEPVSPPLTVLVANAQPLGLEKMEGADHFDRITEAVQAANREFVVVQAEGLTVDKLGEALDAHRPNVFHFIGHGHVGSGTGYIALEDADEPGTPHWVDSEQLTALLTGIQALQHLRLVYLNSCLGAGAATDEPFRGMAQELIRSGVPAVVANQFPVSDDAAARLARNFYGQLSQGVPLDLAMTTARQRQFGHSADDGQWGAPVLYLRDPASPVFEFPSAIVTVTGRDAAADPVPASATPIGIEAEPAQPVTDAARSHRDVPRPIGGRTGVPGGPVRQGSGGIGSRPSWPWLAVAAIALLVAVGVFFVANRSETQTQAEPTDAELAVEVEVALAEAGLDGVAVTVSGGEVTLSGVVESAGDADRAVEVAGGVAGVGDVVDETQTQAEPTDAELAVEVEVALAEAGLDGVAVTVSGGEVTLSGVVESAGDADRAVDVASDLDGVEGVTNALRTQAEVDAELSAAVEAALVEAGLDGVTATVSGNDVMLSGTVETGDEADRAVAIAGEVPGVEDVVSDLDTDSDAGTPPAGTSLNELLDLEPITFASGSSSLSPPVVGRLDPVVEWLLGNDLDVAIEGHTDRDGSEAANVALGQARAEAVQAHLTAAGIDEARLRPVGIGEADPLLPNAPAGACQAATDASYVVAAGDSLWSIAESRLGDPFQWPCIWQANRDQIDDPDVLVVEQRLMLPPLDGKARNRRVELVVDEEPG